MSVDLFTKADAVISPCGKYRYRLERTWDEALCPACFVMLNPSTADAAEDDPTIRRIVGFARSWGCGGIVVVNLFAWRATDPRTLFDVYYRRQYAVGDGAVCYYEGDPVGPGNDAHILAAIARCHPVVAAWGTHGVMMLREERVKRLLAGADVRCLGVTKGGQPKHPLYLAAATPLEPFPLEEGGRIR